jgi:hypothetical protein
MVRDSWNSEELNAQRNDRERVVMIVAEKILHYVGVDFREVDGKLFLVLILHQHARDKQSMPEKKSNYQSNYFIQGSIKRLSTMHFVPSSTT